jgi:hypothetical protein
MAVFMVITPACNVPFRTGVSSTVAAVQEISGTTPQATFIPTAEFLTPFQQFVSSLQTRHQAPVGVPTIVDVSTPGSGAQQQVSYYKQALDAVSKSKKINVLTQKAEYAKRSLLPGETIQNIIVAHFGDSLTTAFFLSTEKNSSHTYMVDSQGSAFELYLFAQNSAGTTFFESDPAKVQPILDMPDLQTVQWVTMRLLTQPDKQMLPAEAWMALQAQYAETNIEASLDDALAKGPTWITVPVIAWNAQNGGQTIFVNPSSFELFIEQNPSYVSGKTERGITLLLPLGKSPAEMQRLTDLVNQTPMTTTPSTAIPELGPTQKASKENATLVAEQTQDSLLQENVDAFQNGEVSIPNEKLFRPSQGPGSLGVADPQDVSLSGGFNIQGEFLKFYRSASDPLLVFGYPITDEFVDPDTGLTTQYFQRARFELISTTAGPMVQLAPLGTHLHTGDAPTAPIPTNSSACRYFQQTGKNVCYAFLQFYDANNGPVYFGNPISDVEIRDGRYVQYYERARMEWQPDNPNDHHVALTDLGAIEFYARDIHPITQRDFNIQIPDTTGNITNLQAHAFVDQALLPAYGQQTVYIIVQDQNLAPVQGANINVKVYYPGRAEPQLLMPFITTDNGLSSEQFSIDNIPANDVVRLEVTASYQGVSASTSTWFRVWW